MNPKEIKEEEKQEGDIEVKGLDGLLTEEELHKRIEQGEIIRCAYCEDYVLIANCTQIQNGDYVCNDCLDDHYSKCEDCGDYVLDGETTYVHGLGSVCNECLDNYDYCEDCGEYFTRTNVIHIQNYGYVCDSCYENGDYGTCSDCGRHFRYDDLDDCDRCPDCHEEYTGVIKDYSTRVQNVSGIKMFQKTEKEKDTKLFYGIELEVEANGDREDRAEKVLDILGEENVILKRDGSLDEEYGFEIVTAPMTFNRQREFWNKQNFFSKYDNSGDKVAEGLSSWNTDDKCGIHIHFSREAISNNDLCRFVFFINESSNRDFITTIAGRNSNDYSEIKDKKLDELNQIKDKGYTSYHNRYEAVNLENIQTVEVRIFKGNVRKLGFMKNIDFMDSLIKFVKNKSFLKLTWKDYLKYVKKYAHKYKYLDGFLDKLPIYSPIRYYYLNIKTK